MIKRFAQWRDKNPKIIGREIDGETVDYMIRYTVFRLSFFKIMIHHIIHSDLDPAMHDHPFAFFHVILSGNYSEINSAGKHFRRRGYFAFRSSTYVHRLLLNNNKSVWTLFIRGPKVRSWGFWCRRTWIHWSDYVSGNKPQDC